jgi:hypothetical protein
VERTSITLAIWVDSGVFYLSYGNGHIDDAFLLNLTKQKCLIIGDMPDKLVFLYYTELE